MLFFCRCFALYLDIVNSETFKMEVIHSNPQRAFVNDLQIAENTENIDTFSGQSSHGAKKSECNVCSQMIMHTGPEYYHTML